MGILDSVERGLERAVNGAFARTFRSGVQPVEIAAGLKRELDIGSVVVDRDRILAPNHFVVRVAPADAERLSRMGGTLERELIGSPQPIPEPQLEETEESPGPARYGTGLDAAEGRWLRAGWAGRG